MSRLPNYLVDTDTTAYPDVLIITDNGGDDSIEDCMTDCLQEIIRRLNLVPDSVKIIYRKRDCTWVGVRYENGATELYEPLPYIGTKDKTAAIRAVRDRHRYENQLYAARITDDRIIIFERGITVKLTSTADFYTNYIEFFDENPNFSWLKEQFAGDHYRVETPVIVVGWGVHSRSSKIVFVLLDHATGKVYLCGDEFPRSFTILNHVSVYPSYDAVISHREKQG